MEQEKNKKTKKSSPESSGYSKNNKDSNKKEKRIADHSINEHSEYNSANRKLG